MSAAAFRTESFRIQVPASAANLGPGYDSFGLALSLCDDIVVRVDEGSLDVEVIGEGANTVSRDGRNLVVKAMNQTFDALGSRPRGLKVRSHNRIPHGRGLGSSSAAIVGGIAAARALVVGGNERLDQPAMLELATDLEGHPDNVAAALLGGFTIAWTVPTIGALRLEPSIEVIPVAFVAATELRTSRARQAIPSEVPHADAATNAARAALMVEAVTHQPHLLFMATQDLLHQEYRRSVMPHTLALVDLLRAEGVAAVVGGAGPSVLALTTASVAQNLLARSMPGWRIEHLAIDLDGVRVVQST